MVMDYPGELWVEVTVWVLPAQLVHAVHTYEAALSFAGFSLCVLCFSESVASSSVFLEGQHGDRAASLQGNGICG